MYVHIGGNTVVDDDDIIVMLQKSETLISRDTRRAIDVAMGNAGIRAASMEPQKTYIILAENDDERKGRQRVYSSPIAAKTLAQRSENKEF